MWGKNSIGLSSLLVFYSVRAFYFNRNTDEFLISQYGLCTEKKISVDVRIFRAKMVRIKQDNLHAHCTHSLFFAAFVRHIYGRAHLIT